MVDVMRECDPDYINKYRETIKQKCIEYSIDPDNFALNSNAFSTFQDIDIYTKTNRELNAELEIREMQERNRSYINEIINNNMPPELHTTFTTILTKGSSSKND